jgi:hypothetical protein
VKQAGVEGHYGIIGNFSIGKGDRHHEKLHTGQAASIRTLVRDMAFVNKIRRGGTRILCKQNG